MNIDGQQRAIDAACDGINLFVCGRAGTGKSFVLRKIRDLLVDAGSTVVTLAPTGIAAFNVEGTTIHSFFRFPLGAITDDDIATAVWNPRNRRNIDIMRSLDTLIVDEVSMVRVDVMDAIDLTLRQIRGEPGIPFGGVQVLMFGDPFQLPPVVVESQVSMYLKKKYGDALFFCAPTFSSTLRRVELTEVVRQKDPEFAGILNRVREGIQNRDDLQRLNAHVRRREAGDVTLTTTKARAHSINEAELIGLPLAHETKAFPATMVNMTERDAPVEVMLRICPGARVMILKNDPQQHVHNGTIGTVLRISEEEIEDGEGDVVLEDVVYVEPDGRHGDEVKIIRARWEKMEYETRGGKLQRKVVGWIRQFPLRLAWAMTIHKCQGLTMDRVHLDLNTGAFEVGQTYVALSRATSLDGLSLERPVLTQDIMTNDAVHWYAERFPAIEVASKADTSAMLELALGKKGP
jgi:ATP-dependent DNA helicase PIF1